MYKLVASAALLACGLTSVAIAQQGAAPPMSVADISACMKRNTPTRSSIRDITLDSVDKEGVAKLVQVRGFWQPAGDGLSRINLRVLSPEVLKGSSYLILQRLPEDAVYLYLAFLQSVTAIKPSEMTNPMWGTGVSYVELKQVQGLLNAGTAQRGPDANISGRTAYTIDTTTDLDAVGYRRIVSYIDQQSCLLLRGEFYARGGEPTKTLDADVSTLSPMGPPWSVGSYMLKNPRENSHTKISLGRPTEGMNLSEGLFDPQSFYSAPTPGP